MRLESDGQVIKGNISFNYTGGWDTWATKTVSNVPLKSGEQILRIYFEHGEFNLGELDFKFSTALNYDQPIADAGPNQVIVLPNNSGTLDGTNSSNPGTAPLTYNWTQIYGPSLANPQSASAASSGLSNLQSGVYKYRLVVDNGSYQDQDEVFIIVGNNSNVLPTVSFLSPANGSTYVEGENLDILGTASDLNDSVQKVDFYLNGQFIQSVANRPYQVNWTAMVGPAVWELLAYDYFGDSAWSAPLVLNIDTAPSCEGTSHNGDFSWKFSSDDNNPTLTFIPSQAGVGSPTCILYYGTNPSGLPGYPVSPNVPFQLNASKGDLIYFYYTYSFPGAGERNNGANKDTYVIGTCSDIGIEEELAQLVALYPNPNAGKFHISLPANGAQISLFDLQGRKLLTQEANQLELDIEVPHFAEGIYYLNVAYENSSKTFKVLLRK